MVFSFAEIQALIVAEVAPLAEAKETVQADGGPIGDPVGVIGFGMRPSLSAGAWPCGSIGKSLALTGGTGCVMTCGVIWVTT
jgi:hypothetical protein